MILQASTEKELLALMEGLQKRLIVCESQNKALARQLKEIKLAVDRKPDIVIKETIIKEIEKPTIQEIQTIKIDSKFLPCIKKLSTRVKALEDKKPEVIEKETIIKEIEKPTIKEIKIIETDPSIMPTIKKLFERVKAIESIKPVTNTTEVIIKEVEKPTIKEITILKTDVSVLPTLKKLSDRLLLIENKKPEVAKKETIIKEIQKPIIKEITILKTDSSILPALKKLSDRLKVLEEKKTEKQIIKELTTHEIKTVDSASKKEIESIKKAIALIKPEIKNITEGLTSDEVSSIIDQRVTMLYINKLYKKGAKHG